MRMDGGVKTEIPGILHEQFGKEVLLTQMRFKTLEAIFEVDSEVQRQLDMKKRGSIRSFIMDNLEAGEPVYFSPFVFSSRRQIVVDEGKFTLPEGCKLYISDGQHRAAALSSALIQLKSEREANEETGDLKEARRVQGKIDQIHNLPITLQIYLDLTTQEEQQMFTDLNSERAEANPGLRMQYDHRDPYTTLTRNVAEELQNRMHIEMKLSRLSEQSGAVTTLTTMRRCLVALFEGTLTERKGQAYFRNCKPSEVPTIARMFFESWEDVFPAEAWYAEGSVCSKSGVQLALAQTACNLSRGERIPYEAAFAQLTFLGNRCTWQPDDPLFSHMYDESSKRLKHHSSSTSIKRTMMKFLKVIEEERAAVLC